MLSSDGPSHLLPQTTEQAAQHILAKLEKTSYKGVFTLAEVTATLKNRLGNVKEGAYRGFPDKLCTVTVLHTWHRVSDHTCRTMQERKPPGSGPWTSARRVSLPAARTHVCYVHAHAGVLGSFGC